MKRLVVLSTLALAVAAGSAALVGAAGGRLLRELRLAGGTGDDEPPLRPLLHRAALDEGEGLRRARLLRAGAGERGEVPGDRAQPARPDHRRHRADPGRDEGPE